tara:strand:+ start:47 stop:871 length:825 start_codon:yes stop_codon:yes gene_type:complete
MLKCAITGANGVLGKRIREALPYKFYPYKNNIENYNKILKWLNSNKFDLVLHLAAIVPTNKVDKNYKKARSVNVKGTLNITNAILNSLNPPKWFFYASTSHVYSALNKDIKLSEKSKIEPYSKYGFTKRDGEKIVEKNFKNKNTKFCIGRIFSFTDKRQKKSFIIPSLITKIKTSKNKNVYLSNLNHYRDFIPTKDIVCAIKTLYNHNTSGIFNIGSGKKFSLKTIANMIAKKYNKKIVFVKNNKPTFLISNSDKLKGLGWKPKKFKKNLKYFY